MKPRKDEMVNDEQSWGSVRLHHGPDVGGWRHFLDGQPIHCGDVIELRARKMMPDGDGPGYLDHGIRVRYETELRDGKQHAVIYGDLGGYPFKRDLGDWMQLRWPAHMRRERWEAKRL